MFWSYVGNFKKILGCIQNQRALMYLYKEIKAQNRNSLYQSFSHLIKNDNFGEFKNYIKETDNSWIFFYPFGENYISFPKKESIEQFEKDMDWLIKDERNSIFYYLGIPTGDGGICGYELPNKKETQSKWFWIKDIFFSAEFFVCLFLILSIIVPLFSIIHP